MGVLIRDEYRYILHCIWDIIGEYGGSSSGYQPQPSIGRIGVEGPPYNPFVGLTVEWSEEKEIPGVVVSGTPGIGKSLFLMVVLALCLLAGQTTVYQFKRDKFILFHADGVYHSEKTKNDLLFLPQHTWFLVDGNEENVVPPLSFLKACSSSSRKLIMAASRAETASNSLLKKWATALRGLQAPNTLPRERDLKTFFRLYGPSARAAYENAEKPNIYKHMVEGHIRGVSWDGINNALDDLAQGYFESEFSHRVLIARRLHDQPLEFYVEFASRIIAELVLETFMHRETEYGNKLYRLFLKAPKARASTGNLLALSLNMLPLGGQWQMRRMKKIVKRRRDQHNQHWVIDETSPAFTLLVGHEGQAVKILPSEQSTESHVFSSVRRVEYGRNPSPPAQDRAGFYIPDADNQESFDAWIYEPSTNDTVILQCTVKVSTHDIKTKGLKWLNKHTVDVVVMCDEMGGTDINMHPDVDLIRDVYRLVY
ncbi:hypothetical protein A7U60_g8156 [Sanghuangporus baumii]|uniref:Uncharacterized protein n=1 Tax=Sanghuangporus baumii TaxID=108892 RepID=A0A9Q5N8Z8_SANBA|nr:hypothetical protein A7U60_g8156 [Sanghuangporus baumii]